jgi:hypothetical protein
MEDKELLQLYKWSKEELRNGNRSKASRIYKVFEKYRAKRKSMYYCDENIVIHDTFNLELSHIDLLYEDKQHEL